MELVSLQSLWRSPCKQLNGRCHWLLHRILGPIAVKKILFEAGYCIELYPQVWKSIDCAIGVWNDGRFSRCEVWGARRTLGVCAARISGRLRCWVDESLRFKQDNIKKQNGQHYNIPEDPQTCEKNLKSIRRASSNKTAHRRTTIPAKTCKFVGRHMLHGHCSVCWHTFCSILQQRNIQHYSKTETSNQSSQKDGQDKRETHWEPKHWNFFEKAHAVSCQTCSQILKVQVQHYCYGASLKTGCWRSRRQSIWFCFREFE